MKIIFSSLKLINNIQKISLPLDTEVGKYDKKCEDEEFKSHCEFSPDGF